jgi:hypothetical protein
MIVNYICRHCQMQLGQLEGDSINEFQLGFHFLTPRERRDIIAYNLDGAVTVKIVCEYCKQALDHYPELILQESPLQ